MALAKRKPAAKKTARGAAKAAKRGPGRPRASNKAASVKRGPGRPRRNEAPARKQTRAKAQQETRRARASSRKEKAATTRVNPAEMRSQATSLVLNTVIQLKAETVERHADYMVVNGLIIPNSAIIAILNDETIVYRSTINLGSITEIGTAKKSDKKRIVTDTSTIIVFDESPFQIMSGAVAASSEDSEEEETEEVEDDEDAEDLDEADDSDEDDDESDDEEYDEDSDEDSDDDEDEAEDDDDDIAADDDDEPAPRSRRKANVFEMDDEDDV